METLNVLMKFDQLICHDEGDGWGSAEPYLWNIFFKIDGMSIWQNGVSLDGEATFSFSSGSHHNLPNHDVDEGEIVAIPANVGEWKTLLKPISLEFLGNELEIPGMIGVVTVLMEEDNVSNSGAEAGHQALNNFVRNAINNFIASINLLDFIGVDDPQAALEDSVDVLIDSIKNNVTSVVRDAVTSNQNWLEDLWAFINPDDKIGDKVWTFTTNDIVDQGLEISMNKRWRHEGDWEINGSLSASEVCTANAVKSYSIRNLKSSPDMNKLSSLRERIYRENPKAMEWWKLVLRNSPFIMRELYRDQCLAQEVVDIIRSLEAAMESEEAFDPKFLDQVDKVFEALSKSSSRRLRRDAHIAKGMVSEMKGKNFSEALKQLCSCKPEAQELKPSLEKASYALKNKQNIVAKAG